MLGGSASKREQIPLFKRKALFEGAFPPPQGPNCLELQPYLRHWYYMSISHYFLVNYLTLQSSINGSG